MNRSINLLKKLRFVAVVLLSLFALLQFGHATYMLAKAELAQVLIKHAWEQTLQGQHQVKPWPWADTWPVARLQYGLKAEADLYILAGAMGNSLAFAPGHMMGTARPGEEGNSIIGGHRDTHFAFLEQVKRGEGIRVQSADGFWHSYRITELQVRNINDGPLLLAADENYLQLITCYPFNALRAGGPMRYQVSAERIEDS